MTAPNTEAEQPPADLALERPAAPSAEPDRVPEGYEAPDPEPVSQAVPIITVVTVFRRTSPPESLPEDIRGDVERLHFASQNLEDVLAGARTMRPGHAILAVEHAGEIIWRHGDGSPIVDGNEAPGAALDRLIGGARAELPAATAAPGPDAYAPRAEIDPAGWRKDIEDVDESELMDFELDLASNPADLVCSFSKFQTVRGRDLTDALAAAPSVRQLRAIRQDGVQVWPSPDGEGDHGEEKPA